MSWFHRNVLRKTLAARGRRPKARLQPCKAWIIGLVLWSIASPAVVLATQGDRGRVVIRRFGLPPDCGLSDSVETIVPSDLSLWLREEVRSDLVKLSSCGYLNARLDSAKVLGAGPTTHIELHYQTGPKVFVRRVDLRSDQDGHYPGLAESWRDLSLMEVVGRLRREQERLLNNGYPYFVISTESVRLRGDSLSFALVVEPGPRVRIDAVEFLGTRGTKQSLLRRYLGIRSGSPFRLRNVKGGLDRLRRLPFVRRVRDWTLTQDDRGRGILQVWLEEANVNRLDGVLGYIPGVERQPGYVAGLLDLRFGNLFGTGRGLQIYWNRKDRWSQEMRLAYYEPFLWKLPLGASFVLEQLVQDSTYIRRGLGVGLATSVASNWQISAEVRRESVLPSSERATVPRSNELSFGLAFTVDQRDDRFTPRRGVLYRTGARLLRRHYQAMSTSEDREVSVDLEAYAPVKGRQVAALLFHLRTLRSGKREIPASEMYRLGGANTLRGYREDQFLGASLAWGNLEYRYVLGELTWAFAFVDVGFIDQRPGGAAALWRVGYGVGMRLRVPVGQLGLEIGLGQGDGISDAKIHLRLATTL